MEIYPHGRAVATLPNQLRPPPSAVNSLQTARFNRDVVFQIPRRVSELAARYGRLRTVCPWQRTVSAPTGARPDRGRTLVREVRGLRAEQGPWSRRRDARTTTKAGLHRPSRAGRVWLLHAWSGHAGVATASLKYGLSSPGSPVLLLRVVLAPIALSRSRVGVVLVLGMTRTRSLVGGLWIRG